MLTGSLAGSFYGAPRATQDIDLVVEGPLPALLRLAATLRDAGLYVNDEAVRGAHSTRGMFNAIDPRTGWKVDFILRKDRSFSQAEFEARSDVELLGLALSVASAEDMIVAKLEWARLGDSERQLRDVAEIIAVQGSRLDLAKVEGWVRELDLRAEWERAKRLADLPEE